MNILPHKSWHVRTKKNIARVRKDEAEAAEKEKEIQRRVQLAAQESRTAFLRDRANQRVQDVGEDLPIPLAQVADLTQGDGHINFFQDLEDGRKLDSEVNTEHEAEKKKEQEDYEKKIGYLVYLGQNSLEQTKDRPWYESSSVARTSISQSKLGSASASSVIKPNDPAQLKLEKFKEFEDPLNDIRKYLSTSGVKKCAEGSSRKRKSSESVTEVKETKKHKSHKSKTKKHRKSKKEKKSKRSSRRRSSSPSSSSDSDGDSDSEEIEKKKRLEQLRSERLEREREERRKAEKLLATLRGDVEGPAIDEERERRRSLPSEVRVPVMKQKYNSQFNPQLARQNYDD